MPAQHFRLLALRMPDRVQTKLAENERSLFRQILKTPEVTLKIRLLVQINVETIKIDILWQEKFRRRIGGVGKQNVGR